MTTTPYARANERLHQEFLPYQGGKTFTSEEVFRFFNVERVTSFEGKPVKPHELKHAFQEVLWNLSRRRKHPELEQIGNRYRVINRTLEVIDWFNAASQDTIKLNWPRDVDDPTANAFTFEENIIIYPGDCIVIAGEGNKGKTAWCLNMAIENMDAYPCYYFSSEPDPRKLKDRLSKFDWVNLFKADGTPKITFVKQTSDWQDVVQPNAINFIDWLRPPDEAYLVRSIIERIIDPLDRGIAIIAMQKRSNRDVAEGGEGTVDLTSAYFTIRYDEKLMSRVLRVVKIKTPGLRDLNYHEFKFGLQNGTKFHSIEEVK